MSGYTVLWIFIATLIASGALYVLTPKGPNQTTIRTSLIMSLICCYIMWAITYMAQLHPLVAPQRNDLRPHH
ncbi:uncharacterized protein VTP21DRAFT_1880 [Calcarisporiella thermophila]|uniref:uncharacterized protein n=1 Tax=Calcarisporiella thermophila TaxID=911321 RepID=UPI0037430F36